MQGAIQSCEKKKDQGRGLFRGLEVGIRTVERASARLSKFPPGNVTNCRVPSYSAVKNFGRRSKKPPTFPSSDPAPTKEGGMRIRDWRQCYRNTYLRKKIPKKKSLTQPPTSIAWRKNYKMISLINSGAD